MVPSKAEKAAIPDDHFTTSGYLLRKASQHGIYNSFPLHTAEAQSVTLYVCRWLSILPDCQSVIREKKGTMQSAKKGLDNCCNDNGNSEGKQGKKEKKTV